MVMNKALRVKAGWLVVSAEQIYKDSGIRILDGKVIDIVPNDTNSIFTTTYNIGSDKSAILGQACTAQFRDNTSYIEFDAEMDI